jgi:hypothetical protein
MGIIEVKNVYGNLTKENYSDIKKLIGNSKNYNTSNDLKKLLSNHDGILQFYKKKMMKNNE